MLGQLAREYEAHFSVCEIHVKVGILGYLKRLLALCHKTCGAKLTNVLNKTYFVILNFKENSTPFHEAICMVHMTQKYQLVIRRILPYPVKPHLIMLT